MSEQWRPIPGFPGYEVSDLGRVVSRQRYRGSDQPRVMSSASFDGWGYPIVHLQLPAGGSRVMKVHILVMLAFVGERPEGMVIRHLDGDSTNNALANLRYGSSSENSLDQVTHGTHAFASRTHCKHGHEYTPENTAIHHAKGRPFRMCNTCHRAKRARQRKAARVA